MFEPKTIQYTEFLSIRAKYLKPDGNLNIMELVRYFKSKGTPVTYPTIQKWERKYQKVSTPEDEAERELNDFIKKIEGLSGRNPQYANLYAQLKGYKDRVKEVSNDITPDEYIRCGIATREALRQEFKTSGNCPVCGFSQAFRNEVGVDTKPEHSEDREVAGVGLPS